MPHGCNDDELPWGKSSKADPLDTKVCVLRMNNFSILKLIAILVNTNRFSCLLFYNNLMFLKYMYVCHAEMNAIMNKISANVEGNY